jgi:hypothetical protein
MPAKFYAKLNKIARTFDISRSEVLIRGIELFEKDMRAKQNLDLQPSSSSSPQVLNEVMSKLAARRWKDVSPEERSALAKKLLQARWKKKERLSRKVQNLNSFRMTRPDEFCSVRSSLSLVVLEFAGGSNSRTSEILSLFWWF